MRLALLLSLVAFGCSSGHELSIPDGGAAGSAGTTSASPDDAAAGTAGASVNTAGSTGSNGGAAGAATATRLVPWTIEADGAPALVMGITDVQQKTLCRFLPDQTGKTRCLPWVTAPYRFVPFSSDTWGQVPLVETAEFSDAACKKPIYRADGANVDLKGRRMALPLARIACGPKRYAVGKLVDAPPGPRYGGTPCAALPKAAPDTDYQSVGLVDLTMDGVEPPDAWVEGTEVDGPLLYGRLRVKQHVTADGARFDSRLVDERWMRTCRIALDLENIYCQPPIIFDGAGTEGDQCNGKPVWKRGACDDPALVSTGLVDRQYSLVGAVWSGPVSFNYGHGGCSSVPATATVDGPNVFVEGGDPADATAVMNPRPWTVAGAQRLKLRGLGDDVGGFVPLPAWILFRQIDGVVVQGTSARFRDVAAGDCNPARMPDGTTRCMPTNVIVDLGNLLPVGFSDPQCTKPVYYGPPSGPLARLTDWNSELRVTSFEATAKVTKLYGVEQGKDCIEVPSTPDSTMYMFAVGAADASWKDYPVLTERNAPLNPQ